MVSEPDTVTIPRIEYDALVMSRFALDLIGQSLTPFGVNEHVTAEVLKQFGYEYKEGENAEQN